MTQKSYKIWDPARIAQNIQDVRASVDWLTMTVSSTEARDRLEGLISTVVVEEEELGCRPTPWSFKGYKGHSWGYLSYGRRREDDIAVLKGTLAHKFFWSFTAYARQISRVDLQVTAMLREPEPDLALTCYQYLGELRQEGEVNFPSYKIVLGDASTRGDTLYMGSRQSSQMGRLYDKGVQKKSHDPGLVWRYEVEYKKPLAYKIGKALREEIHVSDRIVSTVHTWFDERFIAPIFDRVGSKIVTETEARISSAEIKLAWLRSQVQPTVRKLIEDGKAYEVFMALQLPMFGPFDTTNHDGQ